jgi:hypothetical protein
MKSMAELRRFIGVNQPIHRSEFQMPDHRYPPGDPRHYDRADNAGFSLVIALGGFLALGVMAVAISHEEAAKEAPQVAGQVASAPPAVASAETVQAETAQAVRRTVR